ncbi:MULTISPECIES: hypothetical protein [Micromonospora]|uniref:Uncharacterized protein n=1 Tax=Micromonospora yangpuensis TaxID=683228 RepID=A0A1C6UNJ2_9ACTN|nr:hypothetical protein [Micromonospora yangpuensis]GGM09235.1 hypothetical protein GCM10012279_29120 [Micromonospora yangpuensis]SCL55584.1 hypothetical protein GA0070617_2999 [Micromonospora yangpuensis]
MRGTQIATVRDEPPAGLTEALEVAAGFDDTLLRGFARVGPADAEALQALAAALAGSPLAARVAEAAGTVSAGPVTEADLAALAGARSALLGAAHDALLTQLDTALGRTRDGAGDGDGDGPAGDGAGPVPPAAAVARSWLQEVAVVGWRGVDHELLSAAATPVEAALTEPGLRRLGVLLDGLAAELRVSLPVATLPQAPTRRWADLWARATLLSWGAADASRPQTRVSGRLLPLGVDLHQHDTAVQVQLHAVLEPTGGQPPRLVRTTVGAAKVDTIVGPALWRLLRACPTLLTAVAERRALTVTDLPLSGGDLHWDDARAQLGEPADPFATARVLLATATASAPPPLDRHPAGIAEPVLLEAYATRTDGATLVFDVDGESLPVAVDRLSAAGPLTADLVAASSACLGLLRWDDGRWWVQPLAVRATVRKKPVEAHNGDWAGGVTDPKIAKTQARAGDAVAVLRERAGRLLRR